MLPSFHVDPDLEAVKRRIVLFSKLAFLPPADVMYGFYALLDDFDVYLNEETCSENDQLPVEAPPPLAPGTQPGNPLSSAKNPLVLRACCGDNQQNCEEFQRPEEMFGITCCGNQVINQFEEICCENVVRRRRTPSSYIDRCCGSQTLSYDQTCCQGVVHNLPNGECCGTQAYPRNNVNVLCCGGVLNPNVEPGLVCCGKTPYDGGLRETCCGDSVYPKEMFDGCCPMVQVTNTTIPLLLPDTNSLDPKGIPVAPPIKFHQFNSKTHQCCDVPIERYSKTKCCYLRVQKSGPGAIPQFLPQSYDSSTSCCAYPYEKITPKGPNGQCVNSPAPGAHHRDDPSKISSESGSDSGSESSQSGSKEKGQDKGGKQQANENDTESTTMSYGTSTSPTPDVKS